MSYQDRTVICVDCGRPFVYSAGEQSYFAQRAARQGAKEGDAPGARSAPRRCPECRVAAGARGAAVTDDEDDATGSAAAGQGAPPPAPGQAGRRFDRFTVRAKRVLVLAQEEAGGFRHNYIGTEHLVLGLLREEEGIASKVLQALGVELDQARAAVEFLVGRGGQPVKGAISLTPRAKKVVDLAHDEARRLNHNHVGTEHLLLGLVREGEGIAFQVLERLGATADKVHAQVVQVIASPGARVGEPAPAARNNVLTCRVDDLDLAAIDTLLEAGVRTTRSEAATWLIHAGIRANRTLFGQVERTVAEIRRLRGRAQSLAQQAMEVAPATVVEPGEADHHDRPAPA